MCEKDGIVYNSNSPIVKKVIFADYQTNHVIRVAFNTGEVVDVDFSHGFEGNTLNLYGIQMFCSGLKSSMVS